MQRVYGVDFGTSNIKIYNSSTKQILNEKNIIAIRRKEGILEFGNGAFEMFEKAPENIAVTFPIKGGVIAEMNNMGVLFERFFKKSNGSKNVKSAKFVIAMPFDITEVEKRAFFDVIEDSGIRAREIKVVDMAAADIVGAGINVGVPAAVMIVNIGADTTEISVTSGGSIVISKIIKTGGNDIDESIRASVKSEYNFIIGKKTAENLKVKLADAMFNEDDEDLPFIEAYGNSSVTGLPGKKEIYSDVVGRALIPVFSEIAYAINVVFERTPPELSADIIDAGFYLTGGTSAVKNIDRYFQNECSLKVNTVYEPGESAIRGLAKIICDPELSRLMRG